MIYLDSAATTFQKPLVVSRAVEQAFQTMSSPGRGGHAAAVAAADMVFDCRCALAELYGLEDPGRVVFTMNATHALNLAIKSLVPPGGQAVISGWEHNAVTRPLQALGAKVGTAAGHLFDGEAVGRFAESLKFLRRALRPYGEGEREVQTEHLHKTLAVHPVADVAHADRIRLGRGQSDEVLYVLYRCQLDLKFHTKSPRKLYKHSYIVYNM